VPAQWVELAEKYGADLSVLRVFLMKCFRKPLREVLTSQHRYGPQDCFLGWFKEALAEIQRSSTPGNTSEKLKILLRK